MKNGHWPMANPTEILKEELADSKSKIRLLRTNSRRLRQSKSSSLDA